MAGEYVGGELDLFAHAQRWKEYWSSRIRPFVRGAVVEVGAGIGANTGVLRDAAAAWTCVEPDPRLVERLRASPIAERCEVRVGTLRDLPADARFDTVLYVDVLEHIADDRAEVEHAVSRLRPGGHLVVVAPAHPWLFTPFDAAIGHHRRYTRRSLAALTPRDARLVKLAYLDSVGLLASAGNRLLLRQSMPTLKQILLWDRAMVPLSRLLDPLLLRRLGKSIFAAWQR